MASDPAALLRQDVIFNIESSQPFISQRCGGAESSNLGDENKLDYSLDDEADKS